MQISRLNVATRLGCGFGTVLIILTVISLFGIGQLRNLNGIITATVELNGSEENLIEQALGSAETAATSIRNLIILTDQPRMTLQKQAFEQSLATYDITQRKLVDLFAQDPNTDENERKYLSQIAELQSAALPLVQKAAKLGLANDTSGPEVLMNETGPALDRWVAALTQFRDYEVKTGIESAVRAHEAYSNSRNTMLALSLMTLLVALGICIVITRSITRQLGGEPDYAAGIVERIADGDLSVAVVLKANDQTSLLYSMQLMRRKLETTVAQLRMSIDSIATASRQIASGNTDLSARTEEQAASLEETASSMTQLTVTVKQNSDNARQANALATNATHMADVGNNAVQGMVGTIEKISASSSKISEITGVIEGIAFQTNILALNAAVEAARAGEQGLGFAVVASEVRSLAQRSASAAKEIKELISSSVTMIQDGAKQATEVSGTMGRVKQAIRQVSDIVGEIAAASEEQSRGIEQVNQAVGEMDEVTQQNAALVEEAAAAAQSLEEQSTRLKDAVSVFRFGDTEQSTSSIAVTREKPVRSVDCVPMLLRAFPEKMKAAPISVVDRSAGITVDSAKSVWKTF